MIRTLPAYHPFIGVDGTNLTLNNGRFLINLKEHSDRDLTATQIIARINKKTQSIPGLALYLQPVQDLTTDTTVNKAQYQFFIEDASPTELATWSAKLVDRMQKHSPRLRTRRVICQQQGLAYYVQC